MKIANDAPKGRRQSEWDSVADHLRAIPGEWRRIDEAPKVSTTDIRRGTPKAFAPAGSFDAVRESGQLFIRYVGEAALGIDWTGAREDGGPHCTKVTKGYRCVKPDGHNGECKPF